VRLVIKWDSAIFANRGCVLYRMLHTKQFRLTNAFQNRPELFVLVHWRARWFTIWELVYGIPCVAVFVRTPNIICGRGHNCVPTKSIGEAYIAKIFRLIQLILVSRIYIYFMWTCHNIRTLN